MNYRGFLKRSVGLVLLYLAVLAAVLALLKALTVYPIETAIIVGILCISGLGVILYVWELVVIGWVMDFLMRIGVPRPSIISTPLEYEKVGGIIVVPLHNVASVLDCQSVERQLRQLIDEGHCDFVFDFLPAGKISRHFREVMLHVMKAAHAEAAKGGKPCRPPALSEGEVFRVFADRRQALEEMARHEGHGWVVVCSVPFGLRAVSGQV
jgi:hypothetical protein